MPPDFKVKVDDFEGPLGLLLDLIERNKLHINQVSLAQVAEEYVAFLKSHPSLSMGEMASFILIASTLMLIKSVALLPTLQVTPEESANINELERRLKALGEMRLLSLGIKSRFGAQIMFAKSERQLEPVFTPTTELNLTGLLTALRQVLASLPKPEKIPETIVRKILSLEEMIEKLAQRVTAAFKLKFSEFVKDHCGEKVAIIVSFLGMLELVKQGAIEVRQESHFSDIDMETRNLGGQRQAFE